MRLDRQKSGTGIADGITGIAPIYKVFTRGQSHLNRDGILAHGKRPSCYSMARYCRQRWPGWCR